MTKEELQKIIREELSNIFSINNLIFQHNIQILDARNIQLGRTNGTKFGTETDQLMGFYGVTPVNQPDTVSDANTQSGTYSQTDVQSIADAVNTVIDRLQELGFIA